MKKFDYKKLFELNDKMKTLFDCYLLKKGFQNLKI